MKILAIALNTFREAIRNKILYSVVLFAALLVGISAIFGSVTLGDQGKVIKDFGLFSLSFFGSISAMIAGVSLLNRELKQKTIYNIISKPVHRYQFIVGKYLGIAASSGLLVLLMGLGLIIFVLCLRGVFETSLLLGIYLALLEITIIASVTIFFSALVVTTTLAGLFTFATYLAGHSVSYLKYFLTQSDQNNPALLGIIRIFDTVLPDLTLLNMADQIVYNQAIPPNLIISVTAYAISYAAISIIFASIIFQRRELV